MKTHTEVLWHLVIELFTDEEQKHLRLLTEVELIDIEAVIAFDDGLRGPSVSRMNCNSHGRYEIPDRDIFRPLQYCGMNFMRAQRPNWENDAAWHTRDLVEMSSLHIESLIKRIGNVLHLPLGMALHKAIVKNKVDPVTWKQIESYTRIYNDAKHNFSHEKDTHMFSVEEALLAYFVCRRLGAKLYPLAELVTDLKIFDHECDEAELSQRSRLGKQFVR